MQNLSSILTGLIQDPDVDIDLTVTNEISRMEVDSAVDMQTTQSIQEVLQICDMLENDPRSSLCEIVENASSMGMGVDLLAALNSPAPFDSEISRSDISNNELFDFYSKFGADEGQIQNSTNEITEVTTTNTTSSSCVQIVKEFQEKLSGATQDSVMIELMEHLRDRADLLDRC